MITNRRRFLHTVGLAAGYSLLPGLVFAGKDKDGFTILEAREGEMQLLGEGRPATAIWGYQGTSPGPQIRVRQGDEVKVRLVNKLPQPTTIHWHGIRIDNAMDGVPGLTQKAVEPGESFDYVFKAPDAGTYWYHTHNRTWEQMARGLYGSLIVDEAGGADFDRDITLVLDDWRLTREGKIHEKSLGALHEWAHGGRGGNWLTVNGKDKPSFAFNAGERVRIRLINVCNATILQLAVKGMDATIIAHDGQPVAPEPLGKKMFLLAPAQRIDLAFDVPAQSAKAALLALQDEQPLEMASFKYIPSSSPPQRRGAIMPLPANPLPKGFSAADALAVELKMEGGAMGRMNSAIYKGKKTSMRDLIKARQVWALAGIAGLPEKPLFQARRGQSVIINMANDTSWAHPMHIHGFHYKVLGRNMQSIANAPWRDTELLMPDDKVSLGFVADNPGKWLLHCHTLEHTAAGMITWFEVLD